MKLSIIVPVYNAEKYLNRCVDSLLAQDITLDDYEIILVDDGSVDSSGLLCDSYAKEFSNIVVIHKINGGAASARNVGLDIAKGKYIMFVDSDDSIKTNVLKRLLSVAEENDTEICAYEMVNFEKNGTLKSCHYQFDLYRIYCAENVIYTINVGSACVALYLQSYLEKNNIRFSEGIVNEDVDFNNRAYSLVHRILFTDIIVYIYYWNLDSVKRSDDIDKIKKRVLDDLQVAYNGIVYAERNNLSPQMVSFFRRKANSLVVSQLLSFFLKKLPGSIMLDYVTLAKSLGLYPIKGCTLSWKTTMVSLLFNMKFVNYFLKKMCVH